MHTLTVEHFGTQRILLNGEEVRLPRPKFEAILSYLLDADKPTADGELLDLFWLGQGQDAAQNLSEAISKINITMQRKLCEAGMSRPPKICVRDIRQRTVTCRWDGPLNYDVGTFQSLAKTVRSIATEAEAIQAMEQACTLYQRGPFLGNFRIRDASFEFDDWMITRRRLLARLYVEMLEPLSIYYMAHRDWPTAIAHLQRFQQADPEAEVVYGLLMVGHMAVGKISLAEDLYRQYTDMREAVHQTPNAGLTALYQIIREGRLRPLSVETLVERALTEIKRQLIDITLQQVLWAIWHVTGVQRPPRLSTQYNQVWQKAQEAARYYGERFVGTPHLFLALCAIDPEPLADSLGDISLDAVIETVRSILQDEDSDESPAPPTNQTLPYQDVLQTAARLADQRQADRTDLLYLWVALLQEERGLLSQMLRCYGLDGHTVSKTMAQQM